MVRPAELKDLHAVVMMLFAMKDEHFLGAVPYRHDYALIEEWLVVQSANDAIAVMVADIGGAIVGLCGVRLVSYPLMPDYLLVHEWALYVRPEYRRRCVGWAMWNMAQGWGHRRGAKGSVRAKATGRRRGVVEHLYWEHWR